MLQYESTSVHLPLCWQPIKIVDQNSNMKEIIFILTSLVLSVSGYYTRPTCLDKNEVWTTSGPECGGDGCYEQIYIKECKQGFKAGCFCKCGYFRNPQGKCVLPAECPGGRADYEKYAKLCPGQQCCRDHECYAESNSCVDKCRTPGGPQVFCTQEVYGACFCLPGYKRQSFTGKCVPIAECSGPTKPPRK